MGATGGRLGRPLLLPEILVLAVSGVTVFVLGFPIWLVALALLVPRRFANPAQRTLLAALSLALCLPVWLIGVAPVTPPPPPLTLAGAEGAEAGGPAAVALRYLSGYLLLARAGYRLAVGQEVGELLPLGRAWLHAVWPLALGAGAGVAAVVQGLAWLRPVLGPKPPVLTPAERHPEPPVMSPRIEAKARRGVVEHRDTRLGLPRRRRGHPDGGICLGWTADGAPFVLDLATVNRGALVSGTNGAGKTNLLELLLFAVAERGRPALVIDYKGSDALVHKVRALGGIVWSFDRPSPAWNPMQGNPSEVAAKVTAVEGTQTGNQWNTVTAGYVQLAVRVMHEAGVTPDPSALAALMNPAELRAFVARHTGPGALRPERAEALVHELTLCTDPEAGFDVRPLGGVASRLRGIVHGASAEWLGRARPGEPALDVLEAVRGGRVVLFSINANRYGLPARRLGVWALAEAMRVSAALGSEWGQRNRCLYLIDEFSSLEEYGRSITKVLALGRENGVGVWLFTQSLSRLKTELGEGGPGVVADALGNCNIKVVLRHPEPADAEEWSVRLGAYDRQEFSQSLDPSTAQPVGRIRPRMVTTPYVASRELLVLPDYHAYVVRVGDRRPSLVRLTRAVLPPAPAAPPGIPAAGAPPSRPAAVAGASAVAPPAPTVPPGASPPVEPSEEPPPQRPRPGGRGYFLPGRGA